MNNLRLIFHVRTTICLISLICLIGTGLLFENRVLAQTKSVTPKVTPTSTLAFENESPTFSQTQETINKLKQIEILKEKIATRVAQIRENEKGGVAGLIKKIAGNAITVSDRRGEKSLTVSEDTVFYVLKKNIKTESALNKLLEGDSIAALGYYNETKDIFSTKYIFVQENISHFIGKITDIDKPNFTIGVKAKEGLQTVDIETYTKITNYTKGKGSVKIGFSKFKLGDTVHVIGTPNTNQSDRISALRILILPTFESSTSTLSATINPSKTATSTATPKAVKKSI